MKTQAITGGRLVTPDGIVEEAVVIVEDGRITNCGSGDLAVPSAADVYDAEGAYVGPGLIDIHCHGGGGYWFHEDAEAPLAVHVPHGTTGLLATTRNRNAEEEFAAAADGMRMARKGPYGAAVIGINVEGPPTSRKYGAKSRLARRPGMDEYRRMLDAAGDLIKVWTMAPEIEGTDELIDMLAPYGIIPAVGHSEAPAERVLELVPRGLRLATHCMDATGVTPHPSRYRGTREAGVDEAVLLSDDIFAEVIPDSWGLHVRGLMLKLILKAKGIERVILITDAVKTAGTQELRYTTEGGRKVVEDKRDVCLNDEGDLSGSHLTMNLSVRNMMSHTGVSLPEAVRMASLVPAALLGLEHDRGSIEKGKRADIVVFSEEMDVRRVMLAGNWV